MPTNVIYVGKWLADYKGNFSRSTIHVSKPREITCWTKKGGDNGGDYFYGDASGLCSYETPKLPVNLNDGYPDCYSARDESEPTLVEHIVRAANFVQKDWSQVTICSFRNNLNKIANTVVSGDDAWVIDACLHSGTLFLDIQKLPEKSYPDKELFVYYGYKFEAVCTGSDFVDAASEFATVVQFELGAHHIIMAAEIDACCSKVDDSAERLQTYVELKCMKQPQNNFAVQKMMQEKFPKWWIQSFLAGVPTLIVGSRNNKGILQEVRPMSVGHLPAEAAKAPYPWNPYQQLHFLNTVLTWMTNEARDAPGQHLRFEYLPSSREIWGSAVEGGNLGERLESVLGGSDLI